MADDDGKNQKEEAPPDAEAASHSQGAAAAAGETPVQRPVRVRPALTRTQLETLRSRLQKKFH